MEIKPVKNYKKPLYAAIAAVSLLTACERNVQVDGVMPAPEDETDIIAAADGGIGSEPEETDAPESGISVTEAPETQANTSGSEFFIMGTVPIEEESTTVSETTTIPETTTAAKTTSATSEKKITETVMPAETEVIVLEGEAPMPEDGGEDDIEEFMLEGDVAFEPDDDELELSGEIAEPEDDTYWENFDALAEAFDKKGVTVDDTYVTLEVGGEELLFTYYSLEPNILIGLSCDMCRGDTTDKLTNNKALEAIDFGYIGRQKHYELEYELVIINCEYGHIFTEGELTAVVDTLEKKGII